MERIRAAIDKARKERVSANDREILPSRQPYGRASKQKDVTAQDAWMSLPEFYVDPKELEANRVTTYRANPDARPIDAMRTKLLHEMRTNNWRRIAITSPGTKCGKSTICLNLAFSLARQPDLRIMIIELDLRRPSLALSLQLKHRLNFAEVLAGRAPAEEHLVRHGISLAVAASQDTANSAELLQGITAARVIDDIEERYQPDVVLFDMPPLLEVDDTMAFIDQIDATLLVAAAEDSTKEEINRCKLEIESRSNLLGIVLNKCRYPEPTEHY